MSTNYENKRVQIMDKSIPIFAQLGYNKTTLDDIAHTLNMKKNSLYYYFESKEDLFRALLEREAERIFEEQEQLLNGEPTYEMKLRVMIDYILGLHSSRDKTLKSFRIKAFYDIMDFLKEEIEELRKKQRILFSDILQKGIDSGEFIQHDNKKLAHYIFSTLNALIYEGYNESNVKYIHELNLDKANGVMKGLIEYIFMGIKKTK